MNPVVYTAIAKPSEDGGYSAQFHDLQHCCCSGIGPAELLASARAVLAAELKAIEQRGDEWPVPTPVERIQLTSPQFPLLVDVEVEDTPVRVNISIGEHLLKKLDAAAEATGATRSGFIAQAVRERLRERGRGSAEFDASAKRIQEEVAVLGRKVQEALGPDSALSRSVTELDARLSETIRKAADNVSTAMARRREGATRPHAADVDERHPDV